MPYPTQTACRVSAAIWRRSVNIARNLKFGLAAAVAVGLAAAAFAQSGASDEKVPGFTYQFHMAEAAAAQ